MQPTAPLFRQIAGQHQNPFSDYLRPVQPRPIDTTPPVGQTATGWETAPVATAELALGALQGVRQNRIANFLETEKNNENALNQFQTYVQGRLQDPDLTEEGRQAILQHANDVMHRHMQYELRDTPKDGIGGFFKNLLINASGGPIKTREPINWNEATGTITTVAAGHSQKENFNKAVQAAQAEIDQIRNTSGMVMPSQLSAVVAKWMPQVMTGAPTYAQAFPQVISGMAPADPYQEEFMRARLDALRRLRGQVASPQAPPQQQPNGEVSVSSMAQPYLGMVMPTAAEAAPADVRPAESGTAPIPTMDLRNPINRAILKDFGYKIGEPTTIYDLADLTQAVPNSLWDPLQNAWIDASTGKRLPEQQQRYVPHDQIKLPQVSQEVMFSGATEEGGPTRLGLTNRSKANVRWVTDDGKPIYSPTVMEETIGPSGARVYTPRSQSRGAVVPPPQENPGAAQDRVTNRKAHDLYGRAVTKYPEDVEGQLREIAAATESDEVKGEAAKLAGRPPAGSAAERMFRDLLGGKPQGTPATAPIPTRPAAAQAPAPSGGGRLKRLP